MRCYVNLDTNEFIVGPTFTQRVAMFYMTRRDVLPVEVQFCRSNAVVELAAGATGQLGIKKTFAGSFLANDAGWTKTGTGTSTVYTFSISLNTTALNAEFPLDTEASIEAKIELEWTESGNTSSTMPCGVTIYNDVIRGGEGVPTVTAAASFKLLSPDSSLWTVSIGNDGVLSATKS